MKKLYKFWLKFTLIKETSIPVKPPVKYFWRLIPKTKLLDQFSPKFSSNPINMKRLYKGSEASSMKTQINMQFCLNWLISSEEVTNWAKQEPISKLLKTKQATVMMQVFAIAEASTTSTPETYLKPSLNLINVIFSIITAKKSAQYAESAIFHMIDMFLCPEQ